MGCTNRAAATHLQGHPTDVRSVAFLADGQALLSGSYDNTVKLWDATTGTLAHTFVGHSDVVTSVVPLPNRRAALSGSWDGTLKLWDTANGGLIRTFGVHSHFVSSVAVSLDGRKAASGDAHGALKLWDADTGALLHTLAADSLYVSSVAFSADGRDVLSGGDTTLKLWDAVTGALLRTFAGHNGSVTSVTFSPAGRHVVSGSADGTVRIWDRATGQLLTSLMRTPQGDWLAITPEGFFSASPKGAEMLSVVRGLEAFGIEQFYQVLYRPDLVQEKLAGDFSGKVRDAGAKLNLDKLLESGRVPAVRLVSHQSEKVSPTDVVTIEASLHDQGGGIGRAELRINGITVGVVDRPGPVFKQQIVLDPGNNIIELVAYNGVNLVSSRPAQARIVWDGADPTARPQLHVLVAGINKYEDGALTLQYAVPDAMAIAAAFQKAGRGHYEDVHVTSGPRRRGHRAETGPHLHGTGGENAPARRIRVLCRRARQDRRRPLLHGAAGPDLSNRTVAN